MSLKGVDQQYVSCSECRALFTRRKSLMLHKTTCDGIPRPTSCDFVAVPLTEYLALRGLHEPSSLPVIHGTEEAQAEKADSLIEEPENIVDGTDNTEPASLPNRRKKGRPRKLPFPACETRKDVTTRYALRAGKEDSAPVEKKSDSIPDEIPDKESVEETNFTELVSTTTDRRGTRSRKLPLRFRDTSEGVTLKNTVENAVEDTGNTDLGKEEPGNRKELPLSKRIGRPRKTLPVIDSEINGDITENATIKNLTDKSIEGKTQSEDEKDCSKPEQQTTTRGRGRPRKRHLISKDIDSSPQKEHAEESKKNQDIDDEDAGLESDCKCSDSDVYLTPYDESESDSDHSDCNVDLIPSHDNPSVVVFAPKRMKTMSKEVDAAPMVATPSLKQMATVSATKEKAGPVTEPCHKEQVVPSTKTPPENKSKIVGVADSEAAVTKTPQHGTHQQSRHSVQTDPYKESPEVPSNVMNDLKKATSIKKAATNNKHCEQESQIKSVPKMIAKELVNSGKAAAKKHNNQEVTEAGEGGTVGAENKNFNHKVVAAKEKPSQGKIIMVDSDQYQITLALPDETDDTVVRENPETSGGESIALDEHDLSDNPHQGEDNETSETSETNDQTQKDKSKESKVYKIGYSRSKELSSPLECAVCGYKSTFPGMYERHMQSHNTDNGGVFSCDQCDKTFLHRRHYRKHLVTHTRVMCPHCGKTYTRVNDRDRHIQVAHCAYKLLYKCDYCEYTSAYNTHVIEHTRKHTGERLPCPHENCQYETLYRRALKHHMSSVHATSKDFQCDMCDYRTSTKHQLRKHMAVHSSGRSLKCKECNYMAKNSSGLSSHMLTHSRDRRFFCDRCSYTSNRAALFKMHMLQHLGVKPWQCEACSFKSVAKEKVIRHIVSKHNGNAAISKQNVEVQIDLDAFTQKAGPSKDSHVDSDSELIESSVAENSLVILNKDTQQDMMGIMYHDGLTLAHDNTLQQEEEMPGETDNSIYRCAICPYTSPLLSEVEKHLAESHVDTQLNQDVPLVGGEGTDTEQMLYIIDGDANHEEVVAVTDLQSLTHAGTDVTSFVQALLHRQTGHKEPT